MILYTVIFSSQALLSTAHKGIAACENVEVSVLFRVLQRSNIILLRLGNSLEVLVHLFFVDYRIMLITIENLLQERMKVC